MCECASSLQGGACSVVSGVSSVDHILSRFPDSCVLTKDLHKTGALAISALLVKTRLREVEPLARLKSQSWEESGARIQYGRRCRC